MKNKRTPSIEEIKHHLFAPSYALLKVWIEAPETLSLQVKQQLDASNLSQQQRQSYLRTQENQDNNEEILNMMNQVPETESSVPDAIQQLIQQRSESAKHRFSPFPHAGLITLLTEGTRSSHDLYLEIASPLIVILNKATTNKQLWQGWMVATETDYASMWDMILEQKIDAPLDPMAGMVQVWNPVTIDLAMIAQVIGELTPQRMNTLNALNNEFKRQKTATHKTDSHTEYQAIYHQIATCIKTQVEQAKNPYQYWLNTFLSYAKEWNQLLIPVPTFEHAMGGSSESEGIEKKQQGKNWLFAEYYLFKFNEYTVNDKLLIEISITYTHPKNIPCAIEYKENGFLEHHAKLSTTEPETEFICDPENTSELIIKNNDSSNNNDDVLHTLHFNHYPSLPK